MRNSVFFYRKRSGIGSESEEFLVEIVSDTSESESDREGAGDLIRYDEKGFFMYSAKKEHSNDDPDRSAMEAHASLPGLEYFPGMIGVVWKIVEKHIPKPPPEDDPEEHEQHQSFEFRIREEFARFYDEVSGNESKCVHESVPARG